MKFSFLVPNYNKENLLSECLDSILGQTYEDFEIIIIDDCSTDNSQTIIKNFAKNDSRVKYFINESNKGIGYNRDELIKKANGKYLIYVDSDDIIDSKLLETINYYLNIDDYDLFKFQVSNKDIENNITKFYLDGKNSAELLLNFLKKDVYSDSFLFSYCFKKELFVENNLKFLYNNYHEDLPIVTLLIAFSKNLKVLNEYFYTRNVYDGNITNYKNKFKTKQLEQKFYINKLNMFKESTSYIKEKLEITNLSSKLKKEVSILLETRYTEMENRYFERIKKDR